MAISAHALNGTAMRSIITLTLATLLTSCSSAPKATSCSPINLEDLPEYWVNLDKSKNRAISLEERKYAISSWVYSVAADMSYLEPEYLCFPLDEKWNPIALDSEKFVEMQRNGFFGLAWHRTKSNGTAEIVVAYRGTDNVEDFWSGNFSFIHLPFLFSQFDSALEFRNLVLQQANRERLEFDYVVFVGHSLGGGLAQYAQDFTENSRAFVFNSSPNRGRLYSFFAPHKSKKFVTRLYEQGEVLKWPRWLFLDFDISENSNPGGPGMNTRWFQFYKDRIIANHNMKDFSAALTKLAAAAGDPQALAVIEYLKERRFNPEKNAKLNCGSIR